MIIDFDLKNINTAAAELMSKKGNHKVWAFYGEMGAGKTTFIHALCDEIKVTSTVGSPTYSIINEYHSKTIGRLYHMDCYRLADEDEALQAGVEDALFSGSLCFIEWPERIKGLLPADTLSIKISILPNGQRRIVVS